MNGYIYLLRYKDTEGNILNKYGFYQKTVFEN